MAEPDIDSMMHQLMKSCLKIALFYEGQKGRLSDEHRLRSMVIEIMGATVLAVLRLQTGKPGIDFGPGEV